jgi:hypothetical protein
MAQGAVTILALDTTLLFPGTYDCYTTPAAYTWAQRLAAHQLTWLAHVLRTSGAPLKIVVGHYPLYSSGPHGLETTIQAPLRQRLEPLLTEAARGMAPFRPVRARAAPPGPPAITAVPTHIGRESRVERHRRGVWQGPTGRAVRSSGRLWMSVLALPWRCPIPRVTLL